MITGIGTGNGVGLIRGGFPATVAPPPPSDAFVFTINTEYASVGDDFTITYAGTVDWEVDWGDGNTETISSNTTHSYASTGTYTVWVRPTSAATNANNWPTFFNTGYAGAGQITEITQWGDFIFKAGCFFTAYELVTISAPDVPTFNAGTMTNAFLNCYKLESIANLNWDLSSNTTVQNFFYNCRAFDGVGLENMNVTGITGMREMFFNCWELGSPDLSSWDTSSVISYYQMFQNCYKFNGDVTGFDVSGGVVDIAGMFRNCYVFNQDISGWDFTGSTFASVAAMFSGCAAFNQDISGWVLPSTVTNYSNLFLNCTAFDQNLGSWDVSNATNLLQTFYNCEGMSDWSWLTSWDISSVTSIQGFVQNTSGFNEDLSAWNPAACVNFQSAFASTALDQTNTEAMCVSWEAKVPNRTFNTIPSGACFGANTVTSGSAADTAVTSLRNNKGWQQVPIVV